MSVRKSLVENRILEVVNYDEYSEHPDLYANTGTGVELERDGKTYVLPHRSTNYDENRVGIYDCGAINRFVFPGSEQEDMYTGEIIDFGDAKNISELTKKIEKVKDLERDILTSPDNIFIPPISESDSPVMKGLKQAIIAKNIDLDKYADRFGDNYPNDKRQFKKNDMTLFMFERMCDNLDMKAQIIIEDKSPTVPNPIGKKIVVEFVGGDEE